jgi:hypothetical protein
MEQPTLWYFFKLGATIGIVLGVGWCIVRGLYYWITRDQNDIREHLAEINEEVAEIQRMKPGPARYKREDSIHQELATLKTEINRRLEAKRK